MRWNRTAKAVWAGLLLAGCAQVTGRFKPEVTVHVEEDPSLPQRADPSLLGVFEGRVPGPDGEWTKVILTLRRDPATKAPATYVLARSRVGGLEAPQPLQGMWQIERGVGNDPYAVVYQLRDCPEALSKYFKADDHTLLLLQEVKGTTIVNRYTFSRTR